MTTEWIVRINNGPGDDTVGPAIPSGGPAPATTVVGPDAYSTPASVGSSTLYARADHDHGLPASVASAVTQIVAGTNVTISPTGGTGAVTINASLSGSANLAGIFSQGGIVYVSSGATSSTHANYGSDTSGTVSNGFVEACNSGASRIVLLGDGVYTISSAITFNSGNAASHTNVNKTNFVVECNMRQDFSYGNPVPFATTPKAYFNFTPTTGDCFNFGQGGGTGVIIFYDCFINGATSGTLFHLDSVRGITTFGLACQNSAGPAMQLSASSAPCESGRFYSTALIGVPALQFTAGSTYNVNDHAFYGLSAESHNISSGTTSGNVVVCNGGGNNHIYQFYCRKSKGANFYVESGNTEVFGNEQDPAGANGGGGTYAWWPSGSGQLAYHNTSMTQGQIIMGSNGKLLLDGTRTNAGTYYSGGTPASPTGANAIASGAVAYYLASATWTGGGGSLLSSPATKLT